jgi:hypothetical protein
MIPAMRRPAHPVALALATPFLVLALALAAGADDDADEILACVQKNFPKETSVQMMEFRSTDRIGGGRTLRAKVWWKRAEDGLSRVMLRLREPQDLRGAGLLLIEKKPRTDMFVYLPDLEKVRRVTTGMLSGSLFGSDFTYEDFQRLQGMELEGRSQRLPDARLDEVSVHVVAHHPAPDSGSGYERVVTYVARDTCLPLKSKMWERGERLRKVLTADRESVFQRGGVRLSRNLLMEDLRDKTSTRLVVTEIEVGTEIPRKIFTVPNLERP